MNLADLVLKPARRARHIGVGISATLGAALVIIGFMNHVHFSQRSIIIDYSFHTYIALAVIVGTAAPALFLHLENRRRKLIDKALPKMLEDLAEGQEAGMTLLQALHESSKRDYGPISGELKTLVAQLTWGIPFEDAFNSFSNRIGTELTSRVTVLILEAVRLGGDLKNAFRSTASFVRKMVDLRNEREAQLRSYLMVIYISTLVFMLVTVIMYQALFVQMSNSGNTFMRLPLTLEAYRGYLFDLAMIEALVGGFAAGKLSEGVTLYGLKHSVVMLVAVLFVFTFLL